jgi:hypothetical protein
LRRYSLVSAADLPQMDFDFWNKRGKADPYVVMSVRPDRPVNSVVKPRTLAPRQGLTLVHF